MSSKLQNIINLFEKAKNWDYIGEDITQEQHMLQTAKKAKNDTRTIPSSITKEQLIIASLLHDIGHIIDYESKNSMISNGIELGQLSHEKIGEKYLENLGFNSNICKLVGMHVMAKRYLVSKDETYYNKLSEASKLTLKIQGGPMTEQEIKDYENNPLFLGSLYLREYDDSGKEQITSLDTLENYYSMIENN